MTDQPDSTGLPDSPNQGGLSPMITVGLIVGSLIIAVVLFLLLASLAGESAYGNTYIATETPGYVGAIYDPPVPLDDFSLPATTGEDLSLSDLQGKYILLFFGYTHCPDVCPTTLAEFRLAKATLDDEMLDKVTFLFISVDGPRDSVAVMTEYLNRFDPEFVGMSGDDETLQRIGTQYGLFYQHQTETGSEAAYLVDHTGRSFLIDRDGRLRVSYAYGTDSDILANGIQQLADEDGA